MKLPQGEELKGWGRGNSPGANFSNAELPQA